MPIYLMVLFIRGVSFPANGLVFSQKRNQHSVKGAPSYNAWPTSPAGVGNFEGAPLLALFEKWGFPQSLSSLSFVCVVVSETAIAQAEGVGGPASHVSKTAKLRARRSFSADSNNSVRYLPAEMRGAPEQIAHVRVFWFRSVMKERKSKPPQRTCPVP